MPVGSLVAVKPIGFLSISRQPTPFGCYSPCKTTIAATSTISQKSPRARGHSWDRPIPAAGARGPLPPETLHQFVADVATVEIREDPAHWPGRPRVSPEPFVRRSREPGQRPPAAPHRKEYQGPVPRKHSAACRTRVIAALSALACVLKERKATRGSSPTKPAPVVGGGERNLGQLSRRRLGHHGAIGEGEYLVVGEDHIKGRTHRLHSGGRANGP